MNEAKRAALFLLAYWGWLFAAHLLGISLVTYGMMDASPRFNEIADLYFNNYWTVQGWAALLFYLFNFGLTVGRQAHWPELSQRNLVHRALPQLMKASVASAAWVLLTFWITPSQFLGPGFSFEGGVWAAFSCLLRAGAWVGWAVGEEWVFRKVLLDRAKRLFAGRGGDLAAIATVTALWILTRSWHQHLGINQTLTLILAGLALGLHAVRGGSYLAGAAMLGGAAMVFQVIFSLPVLGHEFTGFWIIKYRSDHLLHFVSGGAGGPLSSSVIQLALASWLVVNSSGRPGRRS